MNIAVAARVLATACLLAACAARGAGAPPAACVPEDQVRFRGYTARLENDLFRGTDQNYTNGVVFAAISHDLPDHLKPECLPAPLRLHTAFTRWLDPGFWEDRRDALQSQNVVVRIGQAMYTPADPARTDVVVDDRPYAGLLYVGLAWNRRRLDAHAGLDSLDTRAVTLGVIGPLSLAREAQNLIHDTIGSDRFQGWSNQLGNEPALQFVRERKYRAYRGPGTIVPGFSTDAISSWGVGLGNIETSAFAGVEARIGWNLPNDFGTYPVRAASENRPPASHGGAPGTGRRPGAHAFAGLEAKAVLYDFSLDGNLFRSSHSVDRRPGVAQLYAGFSVQGIIAGYGVRFAAMRVSRSKEFATQLGGSHTFGSITLSVEF